MVRRRGACEHAETNRGETARRIRQGHELADAKDRLDKQAVEVALGSSVEFGAFLKADLAKYSQIVKDAGIRPE